MSSHVKIRRKGRNSPLANIVIVAAVVACFWQLGLLPAPLQAKTVAAGQDQDRVKVDQKSQIGKQSHPLKTKTQHEPGNANKPQPKRVKMLVTAYCPCLKCCGKSDGITASGKNVRFNGGKFLAADTSIHPFGTKMVVPGYWSKTVEVIDKGGKIKGNRLDVFFDSHEKARNWGKKWVLVTIP